MKKRGLVIFAVFLISLVTIPVFALNILDDFNYGFKKLSDKFYGKELFFGKENLGKENEKSFIKNGEESSQRNNENSNLITGQNILNNCADKNTLFKTSSSTNAHASLYDDTSYTFRACTGDLDINDRTCDADNSDVIIKLSSNSNAHVEKPSLNNYNVKVCSSDLSCSYKEGSCDASEVCVASISGDTNAHVSDCVGGYNTKLCCKSTSCKTNPSSKACQNEQVCKTAGFTWWPPNDPSGGCCAEGKKWDNTIPPNGACVDSTSFSTCTSLNSFQNLPLPYEEACCSASVAYGFWYPIEPF